MVSVVIPVYNASRFLVESINSVFQQTYTDLEILVCDDKSTDGSLELLHQLKDPRLTIYTNNINQGYLRTMNTLLNLANGRYVAFHDADDISHPKRIEIQLQKIIEYDYDLLGTNYVVIDEGGRAISQLINPLSDSNDIHRDLINRNLFQKPSILFKSEIIKKVGGFREAFLQLKNISEDYDWLLRINEAGFIMSNVSFDEPLYNYRSVPSAMTKGFTHVEQLFGEKIAQFLAKERKEGKPDSIDRSDFNELNNYINNLRQPFIKDPSLFFVKKAEQLMYAGLPTQAINFALQAVQLSPLSIKNWRTLQYCLRKTYLGI